MVASLSDHKAEIPRLADVAREALERERAQRTRLFERSKRMARRGRTAGVAALAGLVLLALVRKRPDHDHRETDDRLRPENYKPASRRKHKRKDDHILELARLAVKTGRLWESAAARR